MSLLPILRPPSNLWALGPGGGLPSMSAILLLLLFQSFRRNLKGYIFNKTYLHIIYSTCWAISTVVKTTMFLDTDLGHLIRIIHLRICLFMIIKG